MNKYHWYLVSGISKGGTHNKPFGMVSRNLTNANLKWFKESLIKQALDAGSNSNENIVITNISYLGEMTKEEFFEEQSQ